VADVVEVRGRQAVVAAAVTAVALLAVTPVRLGQLADFGGLERFTQFREALLFAGLGGWHFSP
jgi:hypothetical protein